MQVVELCENTCYRAYAYNGSILCTSVSATLFELGGLRNKIWQIFVLAYSPLARSEKTARVLTRAELYRKVIGSTFIRPWPRHIQPCQQS